MPAAVTSIVVLAIYNIWRLTYYESLLPNTFHAKTHFSPARFVAGLAYVGEFVASERLVLVLLGLAALTLGNGPIRARILAAVVGMQVVYVVLVGGDWMPHHRFLLPVLPAFVLLAQEGVWRLWDRLRDASTHPRLALSAALALMLFFLAVPVSRARPFDEFSVRAFDPLDAREIGIALADQLRPDDLIAIEWGGIVPYYAGLPTLELFGLTDGDMARSELPRTVWGRRPTPEYVASRAPHLIVACARLFATMKQARACGRHVARGAFRAYTSPRMEPYGYRFEVRRARERFWPAWVRVEGDQ